MSGPSSKPNRSAVPVVSRVAYWFGTHWEHAACHPEPPWEAVGKQFSFPAAAHRRLVERALAAITLLGDEPKEGYDPRTFTREQLEEFKEMYSSITHSLLYYL